MFVLTQTPLQLVRRADGQHLAMALPAQSPRQAAQSDSSAHWLPQRPQLASSVRMLTQVPPQLVRVVVGQHVAIALLAQSPLQAAQSSVAAHVTSQSPQCCSSLFRFAHAPPQQVRSGPQLAPVVLSQGVHEHAIQVVLPSAGWNVPSAQGKQSVLPVLGWNVPAGQLMHLVFPAKGWDVPGGQLVQLVLSATEENVPGGHWVQPLPSMNVPAGQVVCAFPLPAGIRAASTPPLRPPAIPTRRSRGTVSTSTRWRG